MSFRSGGGAGGGLGPAGDAVAPLPDLLASLTTQVAETAFAAKDVLIEKESFAEVGKHLQKLKTIFQELSARSVKGSAQLRSALDALEAELRRMGELVTQCSSRSRLYLLINCRSLVKQMQKSTHELGRCISLIPLAMLDMSPEIIEQAQLLAKEMQLAEYQVSAKEEAITDKIQMGIEDQRTDTDYANDLLAQMARAVGVPLDPLSLRQELEDLKKERDEAQLRKSTAEVLQAEQVLALLNHSDAAVTPGNQDKDHRKRRQKSMSQQSMTHSGSTGLLPAMHTFYCPITRDVMDDPVDIASGQTYERTAIEQWFAEGHTTDPTTNVKLPSLEIRSNEGLRRAIEEWRDRNTRIRVQVQGPKLKSTSEADIESALLELYKLCEEKPLHQQWIRAEGLIPPLVDLLKSTIRNIRRKTLATLCSLASDNDEIRELMADAGAIAPAVRSLARDVGEGRQAVALLLELGQNPRVCEQIGKAQGSILLLVTMLSSESPNAVQDARLMLERLSSNDQNVVQMAEANHFKPLAIRLNQGSDMTKIVMASALSRMSLTDQSKGALAHEGAIPPLVSMIAQGKLEAKAAALGALQNLSDLPENREFLIRAGVIPPLLQLLFSVTSVVMSLKEGAAATLANLAMNGTEAATEIDSDGNILESEETTYQVLSLLNLASPVIQGHLLRVLLGMALVPSAEEVRSKMRTGGAIQLLLPFLEGSEQVVRTNAAQLLCALCQDGAGKEVADHLGEGNGNPLKALVRLLPDSRSDEDRAAAAGVIGALPADDSSLTTLLYRSEALPMIVAMLNTRSARTPATQVSRLARASVPEAGASALVRFTLATAPKMQQVVADLNAIPLLVQVLSSASSAARRYASICLGNLSESTPRLSVPAKTKGGCCFSPPPTVSCVVHGGKCDVKTTFCLLEAEAIPPLVAALEDRDPHTAEAALRALSTLLSESCNWEQGVHEIARVGGFLQVVQLLTTGTPGAKEKAVWMLEKMFRIDDYKFEYGQKAQMALIDTTQRGTTVTKPVAAKILAHLELLHNQSSYF
eukprot:SM000003S11050  [mRNA]  locus=s3:489668:494857:- [translate_table: standard]